MEINEINILLILANTLAPGQTTSGRKNEQLILTKSLQLKLSFLLTDEAFSKLPC